MNRFKFCDLFELRGELPGKVSIILEVCGWGLIFLLWQIVVEMKIFPKQILPSPTQIICAIPELHFNDALIRNILYSLKLNMLGYLEAVAVAIPLGFVIGLFPLFRTVFHRSVIAVRYLALTMVVGIFIRMFGINDTMKMEFLAFSIFVYLLATMVQRCFETPQVYVDTWYTLNATKWQTIRDIFIPDVLSRAYPDIVNLAAISWTYITIIEVVNYDQGGIGALAFIAARSTRVDKTFGLILSVMVLGFIIDKILIALGKSLFPYMHLKKGGK